MNGPDKPATGSPDSRLSPQGVLVTVKQNNPLPPSQRTKISFGEDFKRFFLRGLAALLPTLITLWLLVKIWDFLWQSLGQYLILGLQQAFDWNLIPTLTTQNIDLTPLPPWMVELIGVLLAVLLVYIVGLLVGNLIGRTLWRLMELAALRLPFVRAIYPAVKQVTDFILNNRQPQFQASRVVACRPHENGIWSIGLVTGPGLAALKDPTGEEMITIFIPSTPTAFTGYVVVAPRKTVVELPMTVEEAIRLLISGGVIMPGKKEVGAGNVDLRMSNVE